MEKSLEGLLAHAKAQLGQYYGYAFYGQAPTAGYIDWSAKQYPAMWQNGRVAKAKQRMAPGQRWYDCAGLIKSYWMQSSATAPAKYNAAYDKSADGLYRICGKTGKIATMPKTKGTLVFMVNASGTMTHCGIYAGSEQVLEARGFDYGVVQTKLSGRAWSHWGGNLSWLKGTTTTTATTTFNVGDHVKIKSTATHYYPGGMAIPAWLKRESWITIRQMTLASGAEVTRGGKRCVLLGKTKSGGDITSWCALDCLEKA